MGTSKARRPLKLWQMQAEGRDHWLIQTFPRWSFMQPWPLQPLQFVLFIWWHVTEKVILPLYKNRAWTSNTGMKNTLYGKSDFIYLEGMRLGSQSLLFPCKKWPQLPRPLCKLVFSWPKISCKVPLIHTLDVCTHVDIYIQMWIILYFTFRSKSISESFILSMSNSLLLSPHSALYTFELNKYLLASPIIPNAGWWLQSPQLFLAPLCLWREGMCVAFRGWSCYVCYSNSPA